MRKFYIYKRRAKHFPARLTRELQRGISWGRRWALRAPSSAGSIVASPRYAPRSALRLIVGFGRQSKDCASSASLRSALTCGHCSFSPDLTADLILAATSQVATLHRRACSLSVDLSPDMISATGGCQSFVRRRSSAVRPLRFFLSLAVSLRSTLRAPGRKNRKAGKFHPVVFAPS